MVQHMRLLGTILLFVGSLTILIAAYAAEVNGVATAIPVLTLLVAIPSLVSFIMQVLLNRRVEKRNVLTEEGEEDACLLSQEEATKVLLLVDTGLRPTAQSVALYFGPSTSLFIIILMRLVVDPENFEGDPSNLNFGPKDGIQDGEPNVSFTPEFNSYGHCLQGALAAMLAFPAVSGLLTQIVMCRMKTWWTECNKILWSIVKLTACCMTIYPTYNLIKRLMRTAETFATSSFCNNSFEWAFGFVIGLAMGNLMTVLVRRSIMLKVMNDTDFTETLNGANGESWVLGTQKAPDFQPKLTFLQFFLGIALMVTVFTAAVFFGLTWHNCENDGNDCVNYSDKGVPTELLVGFVLVPTAIITIMSCGECMQLRK